MPGVPEKFPAKVTDGTSEFEIHDATGWINAVFGHGMRPVPEGPKPPAPTAPAPAAVPAPAAPTAPAAPAAAVNATPSEGKSK